MCFLTRFTRDVVCEQHSFYSVENPLNIYCEREVPLFEHVSFIAIIHFLSWLYFGAGKDSTDCIADKYKNTLFCSRNNHETKLYLPKVNKNP